MTEVTQTSQPGGNAVLPKRVALEYNALGQRTKISRFESTGTTNAVATTDFTYDFANRLSSIAHKKGTTNLNTHSYTYDPLSRLRSITSTLDGTINYTYDQRSQLTIADDGQPYSPGHPTRLGERYQYDANGNREGTGFTVLADNDNRITAAPGETYTYDNEGNVVGMVSSTGAGSKTFQWDHRNRLIQSMVNSGSGTVTVSYAYDAFNRLVKRSAGFNTTYFGYDEGINPHLQMETQSSNQITHRYLWSDQVDELYADEQRLSGLVPDTKWALSDHQGTIKDIADFNSSTGQTSIRHRAYDSFGNRKGSALTTDIVFGYTGKYFDETTGLQNSWNRWYSPKMGRFISQDPIGFAAGDANLYRYVGNSPTNRTDPSGLDWTIGGLTPGQWTYATGVLFYEWGANGYRAGRGIVTGETGRHMGNRAVVMSYHESGNKFDGDGGDWCRFAGNMAQEMVGANSIAEGAVGVDMAEMRELDAWERGTRISSGTGAMAGSAAGGLGIAGKAGAGIGNVRVPYTPNMPVIPLPDFMRRPLIRRSGTMTAAEEAEVLGIASEYETTFDVVGSRAKGTGRNIGTNLPKGKGSGTRSDIDFRIDLGHPSVFYVIQDLECVNGGIGSASVKHGFSRPTFPPFYRLSPNGVIYVGPSFGGAGVGIGIGGSGGEQR